MLADEHRLVADAIAQFLAPAFDLVDVVSDGESLVQRAIESRPDVVLADIERDGS
ncbi:hypothetical protein QTH87_24305 [Variovorax sp. J22P168]|uniref:hypothetical protein n=1 Tax=Variovorax jilinensis TaxID=3053513 RepID=UPI002578AE20|nr:hypothetical protein [Variovorax sp. J22P168]MDM0015583.1 hypothetical protein [Variovorax sp. J22P168]